MRVLLFTHYFWPENFLINDIAASLVEMGHAVTAVTPIPNYQARRYYEGYGPFKKTRERYRGVEIIRVPLIPRMMGNPIFMALNYLSAALTSSVAALTLHKRHFDVILAYQPSPVTVGLPAALLRRLTGTPVVLWVQDLWPETLCATGFMKHPVPLKLVERLVRFIYRQCDRILVQSQAFRSSVERLGASPERITYIPNPAEALYQPIDVPGDAPERDLLPKGFRVLFAGNVGEAQDFPTILQSAALLKEHGDIHWIIVGDGHRYEWIKQQVAARDLQSCVHVIGRHPLATMPRFFALSDVLLATLKRHPIFAMTIPSKVQSYLACGRPIVAGLDGEGGRIVREAGAGIACPSEDPEALAAAVLNLYRASEVERQAMGRRGRAYYLKEFNRETLFDRLVTALKNT